MTDGPARDMTRNHRQEIPGPTLWCPTHDRYEPTAAACSQAWDPDEQEWLKNA